MKYKKMCVTISFVIRIYGLWKAMKTYKNHAVLYYTGDIIGSGKTVIFLTATKLRWLNSATVEV